MRQRPEDSVIGCFWSALVVLIGLGTVTARSNVTKQVIGAAVGVKSGFLASPRPRAAPDRDQLGSVTELGPEYLPVVLSSIVIVH